MIPIEPTRISWGARKMRSELTTAPMVVRLFCAAIGPSSVSRAARTWPSVPAVGSVVLPVGGAGEADAPGDPDGDADGLAVGLGVGLGLAVAEAVGEAPADALAPGDPLGPGDPLAPGEPL